MNVNWLVFPTLVLALLLFVCGQRSMQRCHTCTRKLGLVVLWFLLGIPGFLFPLFYLHGMDDAKWFYEFRSLPCAELAAAGTGLLAGSLAGLIRGPAIIIRPFFIAVLCLGIVTPHMKPVLAPVSGDRFLDRWQDDVCMQSTASSCGAASAATVFRSFGIPLTEKELARECFTYLGGTENWFIARAFRRRGCAVTYRIEKSLPPDLQTPAIAGVRVCGAGHFIAILRKANGKYVTADPLVGRREVPAERMQQKFEFTGFFMEIQGQHNASTGK